MSEENRESSEAAPDQTEAEEELTTLMLETESQSEGEAEPEPRPDTWSEERAPPARVVPKAPKPVTRARASWTSFGLGLLFSVLAVAASLGIDVAPETFVEKIQETGADLVGLSALLTTTMTAQRDVLEALQEAGIRDRVKVMVGGAPVTKEWAASIGADGYAEDVVSAVKLAKHLLS
ncbi:cobalamin-dependent protein [Chloroflexota bacterium]